MTDELEKTYAPWTVYGIHSTARLLLKGALADRLIVRSPFERIPLKGVTRQEPMVPLTVAQVRKVVAAASAPCAALGAATGCWFGAARAGPGRRRLTAPDGRGAPAAGGSEDR